MPNRLAQETSPYLLQHKNNPVDWHPWGPEALERARGEDMPIFLSIGYSACHWCHVMEHESFEDAATADVLNRLFVSIKVDREERPDLDAIYMQAVQAMTGRGGWPMSVFLLPDGRPFYGGTYFPNEERHGMPSFTQVLLGVADAYHNRRADVEKAAGELLPRLQGIPTGKGDAQLSESVLRDAAGKLAGLFDWDNGGFGGAPKFPQPMTLEVLLRAHDYRGRHGGQGQRWGDARALQMAEHTLGQMARGGIYDQIGGGFHRYATDAHWLVPHFEKMLYDNAQLARLYLHAHQATGKAVYRRIAEETCDYVLREMTHADGGFFSSQDADSEGVEGKFFVWSPAEVEQALGEDAALFCRVVDVTPEGNFEGHSILNMPLDQAGVAREVGVSEEEVLRVTAKGRRALYAARERRVHPGRDEKVLTAWNGLMLQALAEAGAALGREDYLAAARKNAAFLLQKLRTQGRLLRSWKDGRAKTLGYLEDYAMLISGLLALYEADWRRRWLDEARALAEGMIALYWSEDEGVFFDTGSDHETLIVRPRDVFDNAMPCGGSAAAEALLRLARFTGEASYARYAERSLRAMAGVMANHPTGFGRWLAALDFHMATPQEIVVVGSQKDAATQALLQVVFGAYLPNRIVAGLDPSNGDGAAEGTPLLAGRALVGGRPAAYVCEEYACRQPVTDAESLRRELGLRG